MLDVCASTAKLGLKEKFMCILKKFLVIISDLIDVSGVSAISETTKKFLLFLN